LDSFVIDRQGDPAVVRIKLWEEWACTI
jgi:hypothetical protein